MKSEGVMQGMKCLVTGASRGIGKAIALAFAKENAELILCSRSKNTLDALAQECLANNAKSAKVIPADVSSVSEVKKVVNTIMQESNGYGVDVLVNNAGVMIPGSSLQGDIDEWVTGINTNLIAPIAFTRLLSNKMAERQSGVIINIGSIAAIEGMTQAGVYSASKFGLRGWSLHTGIELKPYNIKVMLINPGFVATDMITGRGVNLSKTIQPEDIAEAALLPFRTSHGCCPSELVVRVSGNCFSFD